MTLDWVNASFTSTAFIGNRASKVGGGLYTRTTNDVDFRIQDSIFESNTVALASSGKARFVGLVVKCSSMLPCNTHSEQPLH